MKTNSGSMLPKESREQPGKGKMGGTEDNVTSTNRKTIKNLSSNKLTPHEKFHNGMAKKLGC